MARTIRRAMTLAGAVAAYALAVRPRLLRFGATADEVARPLPGDEVVPDPYGSSTMATTLPAPPSAVWPWLVQMGCGRAGWYSYDRLDNGGVPSADVIVPEWQGTTVGDRFPATPDGEVCFDVVGLEPGRSLVLRSSIDLSTGKSFDPTRGWPDSYLHGTWAFVLEPAPGNATRLLVRTRGRYQPRLALAAFNFAVGEPAHFIMQTRQFANLHRRVTRAPGVDLVAEEARERRGTAVAADPPDA